MGRKVKAWTMVVTQSIPADDDNDEDDDADEVKVRPVNGRYIKHLNLELRLMAHEFPAN